MSWKSETRGFSSAALGHSWVTFLENAVIDIIAALWLVRPLRVWCRKRTALLGLEAVFSCPVSLFSSFLIF